MSDTKWIHNLKNVVQTYKNVEFIRVATNTEDNYRPLSRFNNYKTVSFRQFVSLADL